MKIKKIIGLAVAVLTLGVAVFLLLNRGKSTLLNEFVISDTSSVTKIFLSDKNNNSVTITRNPEGVWMLNNGKPAIAENVDLILKTLLEIDIKYPISDAGYNTAVQRLATQSTKVEVYQKEPLIEVFGVKLFTSEKLTKVFYVGGPTQDNLGTLMKTGEGDKIYVTQLPGLKGYLTERFSPKIADWQDHTICEFLVSQIKEVKIDNIGSPDESFMISNNDDRTFKITRLSDNALIADYDTVKLLRVISSFNKVSYEALLDALTKESRDSIAKTIPFAIVTIYPKVGKELQMKLHRRPNKDLMMDVNGVPFAYDMDRCYAFVTGVDHPVLMQYFITDGFVKKLSFLTSKGELPPSATLLEVGN